MPRPGTLLQTDGSVHDWLEGRGPRLTLVAGIDDATSAISGGAFRLAEDAAGHFTMLLQTVATSGLPAALHTDRHGISIRDPARPPALAGQLTGRRGLTQAGRALDAVGVHWTGARSAPAKGRIERGWGTLRDRFVSGLRRAGADALGGASELLAWCLPRHNRRFGVPPADHASAWRAWPVALPPEAVLCFEYPRKVTGDATVAWDSASLALPRRRGDPWTARRWVVVQERLDGSLWVRDDDGLCPLVEAPPSAPVLRARRLGRVPELSPPAEPRQPEVDRPPSAASAPATPRVRSDHTWRRYPAVRGRVIYEEAGRVKGVDES